MFKPARTLSSAFLCLSVLAGCDQAGPDGEGGTIDFRSTNNGDCVVAERGGSNTFAWKGWFPDDIGPMWKELTVENANLNLIREFEQSDGSEACYELCAEMGLDWGGQGCVAEGAYDVAEPDILQKTRDGWRLGQTEIHAEVELGCACQ